MAQGVSRAEQAAGGGVMAETTAACQHCGHDNRQHGAEWPRRCWKCACGDFVAHSVPTRRPIDPNIAVRAAGPRGRLPQRRRRY